MKNPIFINLLFSLFLAGSISASSLSKDFKKTNEHSNNNNNNNYNNNYNNNNNLLYNNMPYNYNNNNNNNSDSNSDTSELLNKNYKEGMEYVFSFKEDNFFSSSYDFTKAPYEEVCNRNTFLGDNSLINKYLYKKKWDKMVYLLYQLHCLYTNILIIARFSLGVFSALVVFYYLFLEDILKSEQVGYEEEEEEEEEDY